MWVSWTTRAPIGAWKCNFPAFSENYDWLTDQQTKKEENGQSVILLIVADSIILSKAWQVLKT